MAHNQTRNNTGQICFATLGFSDISNISNLPDSVKPARIATAVINGIAAPPTFVLNLLIIWTVVENENLRSKSHNILLACLAFTDVLVGLIAQPAFAWILGCSVTNCQLSCLHNIAYSAGTTCIALSNSTLMLVCVERYLSVRYPFFHQEKVTSKRIIIITATNWTVITTVVFAIRLAETKMIMILSMLLIVPQAVVIVYCTVTVQIVAYRQRKSIIAQIVAVETNQEEEARQAQGRRARIIQDYKRSFTIGILVLSTLVSFSPILIISIIQTASTKHFPDFEYIARPIVSVFLSVNSLANPLIMSLRIADICKGVKKKIFCRRNSNMVTEVN